MAEPGDIQGPRISPSYDTSRPEWLKTAQDASNPGRLNRSSIQLHESAPYLNPSCLGEKIPEKGLSEYGITKVPADRVATQLTAPEEKAVGLEAELEAQRLQQEEARQQAIAQLDKGIASLQKKLFRLHRWSSKGSQSPSVGKRTIVLFRTKQAQRYAKNLEAFEQKASAEHGISPKQFRARIQNLKSDVREEAAKLTDQYKEARAEKKRTEHAEQKRKTARKKARRDRRQEQKSINRQLNNDARQNQKVQQKHEEAGKHPSVHIPPVPTTQKNTSYRAPSAAKPPAHPEHKARVDASQKRRNTPNLGSASNPVATAKVDMKQFLAGIKPVTGLSAEQLKDRIFGIKTRKDFKQALADIAAARLDVETKIQLRSLVNAGLVGFMKNEQKFRTLDSSFVAHVISAGGNREEVIQQYSASIDKLNAK